MYIVYTGSSMFEIDAHEGDLSHRQVMYEMRGMSFREYLEYEGIVKHEKLTLGQLIGNHVEIAMDIPRADIGSVRETFFMNQLSQSHELSYPKAGDFLVDGRYLFEVGGKGKTFSQIKDIPDSYLAVDDTEIGRGARIPLWLFGLLY
ncbi:MAG: hypothetical protein ACI4B3_07485 [Prevotella sp.]